MYESTDNDDRKPQLPSKVRPSPLPAEMGASVIHNLSRQGMTIGQFVSNRLPVDQQYIREIAENFLEPKQRKVLAHLLGYDREDQIEYTAEEAQILVSRASYSFITGTQSSGQ